MSQSKVYYTSSIGSLVYAILPTNQTLVLLLEWLVDSKATTDLLIGKLLKGFFRFLRMTLDFVC